MSSETLADQPRQPLPPRLFESYPQSSAPPGFFYVVYAIKYWDERIGQPESVLSAACLA